MIKALLFMLFVNNADGTVADFGFGQVPSCTDTAAIQRLLETAPPTPHGYRIEYVCVEPGPVKVKAAI